LFLFILFQTTYAYCQLENSNWILRSNIQINFNYTPPLTTNNVINFGAYSNITSMSDDAGRLVFYSEGAIIYNRNSQPIATIPDVSLTAPIATVPHPLGNKEYFYFIVRDFFSNPKTYKLYCYALDFNMNSGLGAISTEFYIGTIPTTTARSFTIARHSDNINYWALVATNTNLISYHINEDGVTNSISTSYAFLSFEILRSIKISPDMKCLYIFSTKSIYVADFNSSNGQFSNFRKVFSKQPTSTLYEFSPDGRYLYHVYLSGLNYNIVRFNTEFNYSETSFTSSKEYVIENISSENKNIEDIQLGIDGNIYLSLHSNYLGIIKNPNENIPICNYVENGLYTHIVSDKLPHFFYYHPVITYKSDCSLQYVEFSYIGAIPITASWNFGDGQDSSQLNPTHTYANAGEYTVTLTVTYANGLEQTITKVIEILTKPSEPVIEHD